MDDYLATSSLEQKCYEKFKETVRKPAAKAPIVQSEPVKVFMIYPGNQVSDYWRRSKLSFESRLKELGIQYVLKESFTKPGVEIKEQVEETLKALQAGTDYLIFTLDVAKHIKLIEHILRKEKSKLILQNIRHLKKAWRNHQPFLYVGFDHVLGTKMLVQAYKKRFKNGANYAVLYGTQGYVSDMRGKSFIKALAKSDFNLSDAFYTDFDRVKAKKAALRILEKRENIDFIYACSTDIAIGVIDALKEKNLLGKVITNGWGGGSIELEVLEKGELSFTVMRMNDDNGVAMAEAINLDLQNREEEKPLIYSGDFVLLNDETDKIYINRLKQRAFRYSQ